MSVLKFIFILLEVLLLFNLLIFVHELGHFLAARWRGLKIERFAVWFGKPIWRKRIGDVEYALGCIPAGGYVSLPQMAPMELIEGATANREELPPISALDKIIVAAAGPLFSFLLALVFGAMVWVVGRPVSETETKTVIGYVLTNSPAEAAGLQAGDRIVAIDGQPVKKFGGIGDTVMWRVVSSEGETIPVTVIRDGQEKTFSVKPVKEKTGTFERKALREIQILPIETPIIAKVAKDSPADLAGVRANDIITAVNGRPIFHYLSLVDTVRTNPGKPVSLSLDRRGTVIEKTITPVMPKALLEDKSIPAADKFPVIGITKWEGGGKMDLAYPNPIEQVATSVSGMVSTLGAILSPKSDIKLQHLSGPVGIFRIYYRLFESEQGWRLAIWFSVVLNVNLALLNLLPIPVLDGGHITLALIEAVRRKPVNVRLINAVQSACALLLIGYLVYITFYDAQDLRGNRKAQKEIKFTPEDQKR
jgi:regulator of sigma E protease